MSLLLIEFLLTAERARPYLMTFDSSDSSDFINAVYLNASCIYVIHTMLLNPEYMLYTCRSVYACACFCVCVCVGPESVENMDTVKLQPSCCDIRVHEFLYFGLFYLSSLQ